MAFVLRSIFGVLWRRLRGTPGLCRACGARLVPPANECARCYGDRQW